MKVYEFGESDLTDGLLWSDLVAGNSDAVKAIQTALIAKFELNLSLTAEALDEHDDYDYVQAHLEQKHYDADRLEQARRADTFDKMLAIKGVFICERNVAEYIGCDYWSLLAAQQIAEIAVK